VEQLAAERLVSPTARFEYAGFYGYAGLLQYFHSEARVSEHSMLRIPTVLILLISLIGCTRRSTPNAEGPLGTFKSAGLHEVTQREYRVDPPDELVIHAPDIKELDGQRQVVRPDGKVSLTWLAKCSCRKTPSEIAADLNTLATKWYVSRRSGSMSSPIVSSMS